MGPTKHFQKLFYSIEVNVLGFGSLCKNVFMFLFLGNEAREVPVNLEMLSAENRRRSQCTLAWYEHLVKD